MSQRGSNATSRGRRRYQRPPPQKRSPLNCIVDEGALIAGLTDTPDNSDSLKTWIREGAINVFVPLYTLEKLNMLRSSPPPLNLNARKTLEWLDHITSVTENKPAGHVELQGPDDQYQTWQEVEKYLLPETPLSASILPSSLDGIARGIEEDLTVQDSHEQLETVDIQPGASTPSGDSFADFIGPPTSPKATCPSPSATYGANHARGFSESSTFSTSSIGDGLSGSAAFQPINGTANIPSPIRPLLNYVVWRTHHEDASSGGSGKYILLTNDPNTRKQAQQFGVRAKLLSQLRFIVARDRAKASNQPHSKSRRGKASAVDLQEGQNSAHLPEQVKDEDAGEEEVVFKPKRPDSAHQNSSTPSIWDPDHFGRMPATQNEPVHAIEDPVSADRGKPAARGSTGGRGQSRPYRAKDSQRGRGSSRGNQPKRYEKPIDPDSFTRPPPQGRRGQGSFRRLWEPDG